MAGNVDRIFDFIVADDTIRLDKSVFHGAGIGRAAGGGVPRGAAAVDADDRIMYDAGTGALIYDSNGNAARWSRPVRPHLTGLVHVECGFHRRSPDGLIVVTGGKRHTDVTMIQRPRQPDGRGRFRFS